jgi:hypothetical protein
MYILYLIQCCGSGSVIRCLFDPWIRDPGWVKNLDSDPGSGMNNPDLISERLETIFWIKILQFFDADPGWKNSDPGQTSRIRSTDLINLLRYSAGLAAQPDTVPADHRGVGGGLAGPRHPCPGGPGRPPASARRGHRLASRRHRRRQRQAVCCCIRYNSSVAGLDFLTIHFILKESSDKF